MSNVLVVFWRDIPAQVIVGSGRKASKVQLSERFEQAIDRCAMRIGAKGSDAYLSEWRKEHVASVEGDPQEVAKAHANKLEEEYDNQELKALISNDGKAIT
ncbi:MAG: virulence factor [Proteobacteria bacterium]|jgi:hypothetical protein|nr:virulence factor [Pseudomonadota bacterium]